MFRPVLAIFRLSKGNLRSYYKRARAQPEDGQYRPKHVVVRYIVIKYTPCDTVVFDYIQFSKFHTHNGDDTLPRLLYTYVARNAEENHAK